MNRLQNTGIFRGFTKHIANSYSSKADYVSLRTQNPLVFRSLKSVFGDNVYLFLIIIYIFIYNFYLLFQN